MRRKEGNLEESFETVHARRGKRLTPSAGMLVKKRARKTNDLEVSGGAGMGRRGYSIRVLRCGCGSQKRKYQ